MKIYVAYSITYVQFGGDDDGEINKSVIGIYSSRALADAAVDARAALYNNIEEDDEWRIEHEYAITEQTLDETITF